MKITIGAYRIEQKLDSVNEGFFIIRTKLGKCNIYKKVRLEDESDIACIIYGMASIMYHYNKHSVFFFEDSFPNLQRELSRIDPNWNTRFQHYEKSAAAATHNSNHRNKSLQ